LNFIESNLTREFWHPRKKRFALFFGGALLAIALFYFSLPLVGKWLVREDPIHGADAIAVLSGRFPQRALEGAQLYHRGYAPEIWLTRPINESDPAESEEMRNLELLRTFGVPEESIHVLERPVVNTADELNAIASGLKETGGKSVIVVTDKAHTRRVFSLWDKYHYGDGEVLVHAVPFDQFVPWRWWRKPSSRGQAFHELLGMLNLWVGMPIHRPLLSSASPVSVASEAR